MESLENSLIKIKEKKILLLHDLKRVAENIHRLIEDCEDIYEEIENITRKVLDAKEN